MATTRKSIAIIGPSLSPYRGGVPWALAHMVKAVRDYGHNALVGLDESEGLADMRAVISDADHGIAGSLEVIASDSLVSRLSRGEGDILVIMGAWLRRSLPAVRLARKRGMRIVYMPKGALASLEFSRIRDARKLVYYALIERNVCRAADLTIYSSRAEWMHTIPSARRQLGRHNILPDLYRTSGRVCATKSPGVLGFMADISPRKGLDILAEALNDLPERERRQCKVVVAGKARQGSERHFRRCIAKLVNSGVPTEFRGYVSGPAREAFFRDIETLVVPSRFESFGLTPLEALSRGRRVISMESVGALEYLEGLVGLTVVSNHPGQRGTDMAAAIARGLRAEAPEPDEIANDFRAKAARCFWGPEAFARLSEALTGEGRAS